MNLREAVDQYVTYKRSMGMRFATETRTLKSFCRTMGTVSLAQVEASAVYEYIAGGGAVTRFWHRKYEVLRGFYRFALGRGYTATAPLPKLVPKPPEAFVPYIFSPEQIGRLLSACDICVGPRRRLQPHTCRTLLLLLYGAGLRISEALALTVADVDLHAALLTIRESKFYKTRYVPIGPDLNRILAEYAVQRAGDHCLEPTAPFFATRLGTSVTRQMAESAFARLRAHAGVLRHDGARYQPRLHDLRHTFAVHRLVSWYRQGADVQRLLPQLATFLGHVDIGGTQRYLAFTPDLMQEASQRFQRYACEPRYD